MPDTPRALTFCAGRLVGEPVVTKIRLYNGRKVTFDQGRTWTLDGKPIHPADAYIFRCMWTLAAEEFRQSWSQNNSDGSGISTAGSSASSGETNSTSDPSGA